MGTSLERVDVMVELSFSEGGIVDATFCLIHRGGTPTGTRREH